ncbi:MAG: AAA family ATPase [bacterium]|nr:AAA family ATPase [bacterium]
MYLKRIEVLGFKSFAKKTELVFNVPITSIVGPNGSGKSNVAEAFRWVLGEQSMKSLRGKRGEDLIFNGSAGSPRQNHAYVTLVFDNKDKKFNIDFDEVAISRHIYRDGSNQYFINNSQVRLKDIIELLSVVSLGVSSHHIISQGEADRILNANIYERREMIEDALGLRMYQYKKHESEKKLDKTAENIKQVESLRRELAPHLKFLKKQVEQIQKAVEMKQGLFDLYIEYLWREEFYLKNFRLEIEREKSAPHEELRATDVEITRLSALLSSSNAEDTDKWNKLREVENQLQDIRRKRDELGRKIGRLEGMIEANPMNEIMVERTQAVAKDCPYCGQVIPVKIEGETSNTAFTQRIEEEIKKHKGEKLVAEAEMKSLQNQEADLSVVYANIKSEIDQHKDSLRDSERAVYELRAKKSELLSALGAIRAKEDKYNYEAGAFKMELTEAAVLVGRRVLEEYKNFVPQTTEVEDRIVQEERRRKIERIKIRLEDMGGTGEDVMKEFQDTEERDKFLEREISDLQMSAESLRQIMAELSEKIDTEFKEGIKKINGQFQEFFSLMFGGGNASLEVIAPVKKQTGEEDLSIAVLEEGEKKMDGIDISVGLPKKRVKGLQMLSGGERALTSIALLFAVSQVNPPPFLILDETDAALDESNSRKYGDMIENLSKYSQLIVVTHNRETMSRANVLYGVTMGADGVSRLISIKFDEAVAVAK